MMSPNCVARGMERSGLRLHEAIVTFVRLQMSPFESFGHIVNKFCFRLDLLEALEDLLGSLPEDVDVVSIKFSVISSTHSGEACT